MDLQELFLHHKGTRSYDDLERACNKALTSQRLQQIATTKPKGFPKAQNIQAIAQALGVREVVVLLATAESLGIDTGREMPRLVQLLPSTASDLSDAEVAAVSHLIRVFKAPPEESGGYKVIQGPFDRDLDALPSEADDPPPITGRGTQRAARKRDKT